MDILIIFFIVLLSILVINSFLSKIMGDKAPFSKLNHDIFGWGFPEKKIGGDNFQPVYKCKFCDKEIAQDSNGDWFHFDDYKLVKNLK